MEPQRKALKKSAADKLNNVYKEEAKVDKRKLKNKRGYIMESIDNSELLLDKIFEICRRHHVETGSAGDDKQGAKKQKVADKGTFPEWHEHHTKLELVPSNVCRAILNRLNPSVFTDANIRSLCTRKTQREPPKEVLASIIEYLTDISRKVTIPKHMRNEDFLKTVLEHNKPERSAGLVLDCMDWGLEGNVGIYVVEDLRDKDDGIWVKRRWGQDNAKQVPYKLTGPIILDHNYSMVDAALRESSSTRQYLLLQLFADGSSPSLSGQAQFTKGAPLHAHAVLDGIAAPALPAGKENIGKAIDEITADSALRASGQVEHQGSQEAVGSVATPLVSAPLYNLHPAVASLMSIAAPSTAPPAKKKEKVVDIEIPSKAAEGVHLCESDDEPPPMQ
eukprot:3756966-Amphidinium_carterae.2